MGTDLGSKMYGATWRAHRRRPPRRAPSRCRSTTPPSTAGCPHCFSNCSRVARSSATPAAAAASARRRSNAHCTSTTRRSSKALSLDTHTLFCFLGSARPGEDDVMEMPAGRATHLSLWPERAQRAHVRAALPRRACRWCGPNGSVRATLPSQCATQHAWSKAPIRRHRPPAQRTRTTL